ncbi:hypothetical protein FB567DRAFT_527105 [Paraphoma chrysanthemicola]|uniref:Uncharacterized protein n=1 Tax=Paraphoma chrysanthemicola TaxID=798071 RepID=A0A8K0R434_9PLEO|nr:hypothetical protein FB567DRAFT_527105 [Paraphoma chrysanthemicola]
MTSPPPSQHWLTRYANAQHTWTSHTSHNGTKSFKRRLGLVETSFDVDGTHFGGRADMTATLKLEINHQLPEQALRERIILAWTLLRLKHVLLMSRVEASQKGPREFVIDIPPSPASAIAASKSSVTFLSDIGYTADLNDEDLHHHALNTTRIIQPGTCLSKLHVLPLIPVPDKPGHFECKFLIVIAHQISDGLSAYVWFREFIALLNTSVPQIHEDIRTAIHASAIEKRLPPAQEDLYPVVKGNVARQRWFWAIIRVLRFIQQPLKPTFTNPLRREKKVDGPLTLRPTYDKLFDYNVETRPPNNSGHVTAYLSLGASARLIKLCRGAKVSIGAGCFALAGMSMMAIYEAQHLRRQSSSEVEEKGPVPAFGASFPLNPRPWLTSPVGADSCMLAFSEGILMPFLPSDLPIEGRFRLIARIANRELKAYQKRVPKAEDTTTGRDIGMSVLDKHAPARLLAMGYIGQLERIDGRLPPSQRSGFNPQGELPARVGAYGATCGVSSVGSTAAFFRPGEYNLDDISTNGFAADYRGLRMGVRARENEFLVGSSTDAAGIVGFGVSYDENAISQEAARGWAKTVEGLLEKGDVSRL